MPSELKAMVFMACACQWCTVVTGSFERESAPFHSTSLPWLSPVATYGSSGGQATLTRMWDQLGKRRGGRKGWERTDGGKGGGCQGRSREDAGGAVGDAVDVEALAGHGHGGVAKGVQRPRARAADAQPRRRS